MEKDMLKDYLASRLISFGKTVDGYGNLYYQTNEDLIEQYLDIDFKDKEVLSVLASGDQVFTSRFLDAKKTDAFDCNPLPIYYFYLRIWAIEYREELYPNIFSEDKNWLSSLLNQITPRNENEKRALAFFKKHVKFNTDLVKLFYEVYFQPPGRTLFTKASDITSCTSPDLDYYHIDIFEPLELPQSYEIVILSNVLEWSNNSPEKLITAYNNLKRLVKKDGVIICSRIINRKFDTERTLFSESFDYEPQSKGYIYVKKND